MRSCLKPDSFSGKKVRSGACSFYRKRLLLNHRQVKSIRNGIQRYEQSQFSGNRGPDRRQRQDRLPGRQQPGLGQRAHAGQSGGGAEPERLHAAGLSEIPIGGTGHSAVSFSGDRGTALDAKFVPFGIQLRGDGSPRGLRAFSGCRGGSFNPGPDQRQKENAR